MKQDITRLQALPLITHDPFFSIWDCGYTPTAGDTRHWSGVEKRLRGTISVGGYKMRFLGAGANPAMPRTRQILHRFQQATDLKRTEWLLT